MVINKLSAVLVALSAIAIPAIALFGGFGNPLPGLFGGAGQDITASSGISDSGPPLPEIGLPNAVADEELLLDVKPETAKEINDARPLTNLTLIPAAPFASRLTGQDRERAQMCLAIAGIYEAGDNTDDQRPVMQVVLNRVRHPAFPNSVCAVVFQGSERRTGCQFSFTCDGSILRYQPNVRTLLRAKALAGIMLRDGVDKRVGQATHYHTDWVVPYWSSSLDKLAQIKTHIFFGWKGYWGQKSAFKAQSSGAEPLVPEIARMSASHLAQDEILGDDADGALDSLAIELAENGEAAGPGEAAIAAVQAPKIPIRRLSLSANSQPGRWSLEALKICGNLPECRVVGWANPASAPSELTRAALIISPPDFVFVQELRNRVQAPHWDCAKWPKASTSQCLGKATDRVRLVAGGQ